MKTFLFASLTALGFVLALEGQPTVHANSSSHPRAEETTQTSNEGLIAIDVLLQPDQTMVGKSRALNAQLRGNYPAGYELDATHAPHVTLLQRFVRAKDLDAVTAALSQVLAAERPAALTLKAKGIDYVMWGGVAVTVLVVERTPELMRLHQKVIYAVAPFSRSGGTASAFVGGDANAETIGWVETFVPKSAAENYLPHVTAGVASEAFVKQLKAASFEAFTFKPADVAVYSSATSVPRRKSFGRARVK